MLGPTINHRWSYATAKQLLERYVLAHHRENGLPFTIFRPYNWFGPRMDFLSGRDGEGVPRVLACFMSVLLDGQPMRLVDGGGARRTFTYIDDAIDALMSILAKPEQSRNQIFNVGNGDGEVTIRELAHMMREVAAEISGDVCYVDHSIEDVSSLEFYGPAYEDCDRRVPDLRKAETRLGWRAKTNLRETLRITMPHYFDTYGRSEALTIVPAAASGVVAAHPVA